MSAKIDDSDWFAFKISQHAYSALNSKVIIGPQLAGSFSSELASFSKSSLAGSWATQGRSDSSIWWAACCSRSFYQGTELHFGTPLCNDAVEEISFTGPIRQRSRAHAGRGVAQSPATVTGGYSKPRSLRMRRGTSTCCSRRVYVIISPMPCQLMFRILPS